MPTIDDLVKGGTAHDPASGQFTSGSGSSYTVGKPKKLSDTATSQDVAHVDGTPVGQIQTHHGEYFTAHGNPKTVVGQHALEQQRPLIPSKPRTTSAERTGYKPNRYHISHDSALHALTHAHETGSVGDFSSKAAMKRTLDSRKTKFGTIGELAKYAGDPMPASTSDVRGPFIGSYEDSLRRIRGPVIMASGCSDPPKFNDDGRQSFEVREGRQPHYLDVVATYPEHAFVRCSDEDRVWKVPYTMSDDGVIDAGEPEEVVAQFVPVDEADDDEMFDGDGMGADDPD